jgi:quercetin dioxygenase-like cupin family protein
MKLEEVMRGMPQVELETLHNFANGMYCRSVLIQAGSLVVGREHKTEHFAIIAKGRVTVRNWEENENREYVAGDIITSRPGTKRVVFAHEDSVFMTVHRTKLTSIEKLEKFLVITEKDSLVGLGNKLKEPLLCHSQR